MGRTGEGKETRERGGPQERMFGSSSGHDLTGLELRSSDGKSGESEILNRTVM